MELRDFDTTRPPTPGTSPCTGLPSPRGPTPWSPGGRTAPWPRWPRPRRRPPSSGARTSSTPPSHTTPASASAPPRRPRHASRGRWRPRRTTSRQRSRGGTPTTRSGSDGCSWSELPSDPGGAAGRARAPARQRPRGRGLRGSCRPGRHRAAPDPCDLRRAPPDHARPRRRIRSPGGGGRRDPADRGGRGARDGGDRRRRSDRARAGRAAPRRPGAPLRHGAYHRASGTPTFHPYVVVAFSVTGTGHLHVPLLLSPFAYSTYRGS